MTSVGVTRIESIHINHLTRRVVKPHSYFYPGLLPTPCVTPHVLYIIINAACVIYLWCHWNLVLTKVIKACKMACLFKHHSRNKSTQVGRLLIILLMCQRFWSSRLFATAKESFELKKGGGCQSRKYICAPMSFPLIFLAQLTFQLWSLDVCLYVGLCAFMFQTTHKCSQVRILVWNLKSRQIWKMTIKQAKVTNTCIHLYPTSYIT